MNVYMFSVQILKNKKYAVPLDYKPWLDAYVSTNSRIDLTAFELSPKKYLHMHGIIHGEFQNVPGYHTHFKKITSPSMLKDCFNYVMKDQYKNSYPIMLRYDIVQEIYSSYEIPTQEEPDEDSDSSIDLPTPIMKRKLFTKI